MNYEKAYKDALERARELAGKCGEKNKDLYIEDYSYIFPELKESEDELKWLTEFIREEAYYLSMDIRDNEDRIKLKNLQRSLAWLEKQGEQNNVSIWKHWKDGIAGNGEGKLIYLIKSCNTYSLSSCLSSECDYIELSELDKLMVEKQGEQNQEHFELKAGHWYICHRAYCCRADHLTVMEGERFMCEEDGVVKGFVIKYPEKYFKEICAPEPIEDDWSEEDEIGFDDAMWAIKRARSIARDENDMGNLWYAERWLKSIKERMKGGEK